MANIEKTPSDGPEFSPSTRFTTGEEIATKANRSGLGDLPDPCGEKVSAMARTATSPGSSKWMLVEARQAALMRNKIHLALFGVSFIIPVFIEVFSASR